MRVERGVDAAGPGLDGHGGHDCWGLLAERRGRGRGEGEGEILKSTERRMMRRSLPREERLGLRGG